MQRIIGGRYELSEELGGGAFGRVWRGLDRGRGTEVAVREVRPGAGSEADDHDRAGWLARVEGEARNVAAQLRGHPNVLAVQDVVVEDGTLWIVTDYVRGRTLAQYLAEAGALPVAQVAAVARGLLAALGAAHERGIVHGYVKPSNVMLTDGGGVLLAGFGMAAQGADTPGDLYALGATLYEAVQGVSPVGRDTLEEPAAGGWLTPLIGALLAVDPGDRPTVSQASGMLDAASAAAAAWGMDPGPATASGAANYGPPTASVMAPGPAPASGPVGGQGPVSGMGPGPAPMWSAAGPESASRRGRKQLVPIIAVIAVVGVGAAVAAITLTSGGKDHNTSAPGQAAATSSSTSAPAPTTSSTPSPSTTSDSDSPPVVPPTSASTSTAPQSITVWLQVDAEQMWPQAVTSATTTFERDHPGVKVKIEFLSWTSHLQKYSASTAAGITPDVAEFATSEIPGLVSSGGLKDISADKAQFDNSSTWRTALLGPCQANGMLYCVPYYAGERNGTVIGGSDLVIPAAAPHPDLSEAWIKDFTSTAIEQQIAAAGRKSTGPVKIVANTTTIP